jgi:hypothetical protein
MRVAHVNIKQESKQWQVLLELMYQKGCLMGMKRKEDPSEDGYIG